MILPNARSADNPPMTNSLSSRHSIWALALSVCVLAAYANSFNGVFHFDDVRSIEKNESIRSLASPGRLLLDPENVARPVVAFTFALDFALFGTKPGALHGVNVAVHLFGTLLLFGIVRRSLLSEKWRHPFGSSATPLAFSVALIWGIHPLQTESVTYIAQRAESMMGMFFILAVYCAIRGSDSESKTQWHLVAIVAAVLGAGCKQVIVVLPIVVLFYDRCFISGTFKSALKRAPVLYAGLCASWVIVAILLTLLPTVSAAGFGMDKIGPIDYAKTQAVVIVQYLRLAFWPAGLCLDYAWKIERDWSRILPFGVLVMGLLGTTVWQLSKNTALGFCGAWFFLTLAPTSSIMPIADALVEHRMYLALAAVSVAFVFGVFSVLKKSMNALALKATVALCVLIGLALGAATIARNTDYADYLGMLNDVIAKRPENPRAYSMIAMDALKKGDNAQALRFINKAVELRPNSAEIHHMKGTVLAAQKDVNGAITEFRTAVELKPLNVFSWVALCEGWIFRDKGNDQIQRVANVLKRAQDIPAVHLDLGSALASAGRYDDAIFEFNYALKLQPESENAMLNRGTALELAGKETDAFESYKKSLQENPDRLAVANALARIQAMSLNEKLRNGKQAVALAERVCALTQNHQPFFLDTLAAAYAEAGQFDPAIATAESALKLLQPADPLYKNVQSHLALFKAKQPCRNPK